MYIYIYKRVHVTIIKSIDLKQMNNHRNFTCIQYILMVPKINTYTTYT